DIAVVLSANISQNDWVFRFSCVFSVFLLCWALKDKHHVKITVDGRRRWDLSYSLAYCASTFVSGLSLKQEMLK
uniref:Uncharacterized protein n=1 Tax=Ciona intestinalis TaxID=7719 RepID=H2XXP0_CIOIN